MRCHICAEPSTGQCHSCWKFYCPSHGDKLCEKCRGEAKDRGLESWVGPTQVIRVSAADPADEDAVLAALPGEMKAEVLERVIPIAQTRSHESTELTIMSLESYEDGFIVHYRVRSLDDDDPSVAMGLAMFTVPHPSFTGRDDRGNQYNGVVGGGGGGRGSDWRAEMRFKPRIDTAASELTLVVEQVQWSGFGPGQKSRVELGPWEFVVPLT